MASRFFPRNRTSVHPPCLEPRFFRNPCRSWFQCKEERRRAHCPSSSHCRIHLRPKLLVLLMISPRQFHFKTDVSPRSSHLSTKILLATSVSCTSKLFKWISGKLRRKQRWRKFHFRLVYMESLWRIQVRRIWIMKELIDYTFRGNLIVFGRMFACFVQNPDMAPLFHILYGMGSRILYSNAMW